uniref:Uncharacterized protein AlNc14C176G8134 n=1 Tax=Albugo laibachii Nc14 TaxID=890382 RepID=F0WNX9_9STRA|nr:conserved hypothetical protein [Albugo laibachii Nc14]|eukprot:CCA23022.1 conserved hypothetical protein [Albugo laibachii Nc14]
MHSPPNLPNLKVDALDLRVIDESMSTLLHRTLTSFRENKVLHSKWILLSSRHQVQVYRNSKESKLHNRPQESDSVTSAIFVDSIQTLNGCDLKTEISPSIRVHLTEPQIMANGFMEGSVDDFLYGIYSSDDVEWNQDNIHICNRMFRSFTIANLRKPDEVDPFRTLTLRWGMRENPLMSSVLIRRKDLCFVQATGAKKDADGERYGYFIMQSITHPNIPQTNAFASKLSICFIVRSRPSDTSTNSIDFHALVSFGSKGILSSAVGGRMLAKVIMGMADISNRAFLKKLSNAIGRNSLLQPSKEEMSSLLSPINCHCRRGNQVFRARWNNSRSCRRCDRVVCAKCSVNFHIPEKFLLGSRMKTEVKLMCFCLQCVVQIHHVSSWEIAQERVKLLQ